MEITTRFDLNEAMRHWRGSLRWSPALLDSDVDEIEAHLRDSVLDLQSTGIDSEEAFLVASRRIGDRQELSREFGKAHPNRLWLDRALWMIAGFLLFSFVWWCSAVVSGTILVRTLAISANTHWVGFLSAFARWAFIPLAIIGFWWFATRGSDRFAPFARLCLRRPLLPVIAIVALNYSYHPAVQWLMNMAAPEASPDMSLQFPILSAWTIWGYRLETATWMTALCYLAWRQWRTSASALREHGAHSVEDLEAPFRERARVLLSKGLTLEEATFLVTRRRDSSKGPNAAFDKGLPRQIWFERGFWMIAGILLIHYFTVDLSFAVQRPMLTLANSWPVNGHLLGFVSVCLGWSAVVAAVAGAWRIVARWPALGASIGRFGQQRPILGVLALVLLYFAFGSLRWLLFIQAMPEAPIQFGDDAHLVSRWHEHGIRLLFNVFPVVLFFWLSRNRLKALVSL